MTGEETYAGRNSETNEVSLNGDTGKFFYFDRAQERDPKTGKYTQTPLDAGLTLKFDPDTGEKEITGSKPLKVIFLKIRRTLSFYHPENGKSMRTLEHNTKYDETILYGPEKGQREAGTGESLRTLHDELRTIQKVYCYFPERKEVVRLVVKGSSLGSKAETPGIKKFYDYLQTYKKPDHFYEYITEIVPIPEKGPKGIYFAMSFSRGEKLSEEQQTKVVGLIKEIHAQTEKDDELVKKRIGTMDKVETPREVEVSAEDFSDAKPEIEYPNEEIDPADIPF